MPDWGRIGLGAATFGMSEGGGLRPLYEKLSGEDPLSKESLFGAEIDPSKARFDDRDYLSRHMKTGLDAGPRTAPRAGNTRLGAAAQLAAQDQAQWRDQQMAMANRLGAIASGAQKGAGEMAVDRQVGQAAAQQQAMARMNRGMTGASAARGAARNVAGLGVAGAGQSQQAALGDQMAANQMLGNVLSQGRGADIGIAGQNAQMQQQQMLQQGQMNQATGLANMSAQLQMMGMDDAKRNALLQQMMQMNQSEMAGRLGQEQVAMGQPSNMASMMQTFGPIIAAAAMSDKRAKKNIRNGGSDVDEMLDALKATSYEYRDGVDKRYTGELGDGRRIAGFLAQDLEKSKAGKAIVSTNAEGAKVVNVAGGMFAALAASARLHERVKELEGKKG
jgi:hypothetical protein